MTKVDAYPQERVFLKPLRDGSGSVMGYQVCGTAARNWARSSELFDDFLAGLTSPPWRTTLVGVGSTLDNTFAFGCADAAGLQGQGVWRGSTGITNAGSTDVYSYATMQCGRERFRQAIRLTTHEKAAPGEDYYLAAGWSDSVLSGGPPPGNGAWWSYDRTNTGEFWVCNYRAAAGAVTSVVSSITRQQNTYQVLEIEIDGETSHVSFYVDGVLACMMEPAAAWDNLCVVGVGIRKQSGITERHVFCDFIRVLIDGSTDRGAL